VAWQSEDLLGNRGNPRGSDGLSAGEDLGEEADPVGSEGRESGWKRVSLAAATKNSSRGEGHDPNVCGCPMGDGGLGIWRRRNGSCQLAFDQLVPIGQQMMKVG
jgi:hypothetical protein